MENGNIVICKDPKDIRFRPDEDGTIDPDLEIGKEYKIELCDYSLISKKDGPSGIFEWTRLKLFGVNGLKRAKLFEVKR